MENKVKLNQEQLQKVAGGVGDTNVIHVTCADCGHTWETNFQELKFTCRCGSTNVDMKFVDPHVNYND